MIRVTIELLPFGDESRARYLGTAIIANDCTGTESMGYYNVRLYKQDGTKVWRLGRVEGFPRKIRGSWDLLCLALKNIVGDRN